eukprot:TRINITY_DN22212_c1_g3_i1.p1 TRINITY_DN22212_c1_g3~~TRINITY_DN22212_c1_g3_i1.p1  ORF type:complete len:662 (-),score=147.68 TRINITY_DN22212_c1_g3_i1:60-2045(-)
MPAPTATLRRLGTGQATEEPGQIALEAPASEGGRRLSKASTGLSAAATAGGGERRSASKASTGVASAASASTQGLGAVERRSERKPSNASALGAYASERRGSKASTSGERRGSKASVASAPGGERRGSKVSVPSFPSERRASKGFATYELRDDSTSTYLAGRLSREPTTVPTEEHPLTLKIIEMERQRPAKNFEAWLDGGLVVAKDDSDDESAEALDSQNDGAGAPADKVESEGTVRGAVPLPDGYEYEGGGLVLGLATGVWIWPVRLSMVEENSDGARLPQVTLYHYTHKKCFDALVQICSRGAEDVEARIEVRKLCLQKLKSDCKERASGLSHHNPQGDPELSLLEPAKFPNKEFIVRRLFGKTDVDASSRHGICFRDFADYCFAISLPKASCRQVESMDSTQATLMRIDLEHITGYLGPTTSTKNLWESRRSSLKSSSSSLNLDDFDNKNAKAKAKAQPKPVGFGSRLARFFCCRGGDERPEFWDEGDDSSSLEVFDREARTLDPRRRKMQEEWLKQHCKVQVNKNQRIAREEELDRREDAAIKALYDKAEGTGANEANQQRRFSMKMVDSPNMHGDPVLSTALQKTFSNKKKTEEVIEKFPDSSNMYKDITRRSSIQVAEAAKARMKARRKSKETPTRSREEDGEKSETGVHRENAV